MNNTPSDTIRYTNSEGVVVIRQRSEVLRLYDEYNKRHKLTGNGIMSLLAHGCVCWNGGTISRTENKLLNEKCWWCGKHHDFASSKPSILD